MIPIRRREWSLPERAATPPLLAFGRRGLIGGGLAFGFGLPAAARAKALNPLRFDPGRPLTPAEYVETYNNFYEFGSEKNIWPAAQKMQFSPWSIRIDGLVEKPFTIGFEDLLKKVTQDERVYRHRCVEAWALTVPWRGFPMRGLLDLARPLSAAKYVAFTSVEEPAVMPGLAESWYPWPYREGLTIAEAANELAYFATGAYGRPLKPQNGAPIRAVLPWKYGFKSVKSIVRLSFVARKPPTFWSQVVPNEYGFWANVNPAVPHPRWSQKTERLIGFDRRVPTRIYNGYGKWVASLYAGMPPSIWLFR